MKKCRIVVSDSNYVLSIRNVVRNFMKREYRTIYPIEVDRKRGSIDFALPYGEFNSYYAKLQNQLGNRHMMAHLRRAKLSISIVG